MKRYIFIVMLSLMGLTVTGCATYRPAGNGSIAGYTDTKISDGIYRVTYTGATNDSPKIYRWFMRRAAELTAQDGYKYFKIEGGESGFIHRGLANFGAGEIKIPQYSGTVRMLHDNEKDCFKAQEILSIKEQ